MIFIGFSESLRSVESYVLTLPPAMLGNDQMFTTLTSKMYKEISSYFINFLIFPFIVSTLLC